MVSLCTNFLLIHLFTLYQEQFPMTWLPFEGTEKRAFEFPIIEPESSSSSASSSVLTSNDGGGGVDGSAEDIKGSICIGNSDRDPQESEVLGRYKEIQLQSRRSITGLERSYKYSGCLTALSLGGIAELLISKFISHGLAPLAGTGYRGQGALSGMVFNIYLQLAYGRTPNIPLKESYERAKKLVCDTVLAEDFVFVNRTRESCKTKYESKQASKVYEWLGIFSSNFFVMGDDEVLIHVDYDPLTFESVLAHG
ncbi:uncharacterized protein BDR25DRAFT_361988 [Lindgomyces ingoldianus]|uniref:Uncharacterized protein n=1 Tax=Lindgomyces ingoldianus TaxID=673940 RepID=A0ACB6QAU5_9PLEO|nr:uncharacterized protein BDR25DRAFT_361988 [Lindgomyces ingoldianus]KAF2464058.1 hypothetical protein BDR25DRAFT_361988 [Lindgomyces ingoldianus]